MSLEKQLSLYGWPVKTVFFTLVIVFLFLALQEQCSMCRMFNWLATCSKRSEVSSLSLLAALWVGWWRTFFLYKLFYVVEAQPPREFPLSKWFSAAFHVYKSNLLRFIVEYLSQTVVPHGPFWKMKLCLVGYQSFQSITQSNSQKEPKVYLEYFLISNFFTQWTSYGLLLGQLKWKLHRIQI